MNDVIKKPVEPEKMFLTLATHLHPHRPRPEFSSSAHVTPVTDSVGAPATPKSDALAQWDRQALQTYVGKQPQRQQKLLVTFLVSAEEIVRAIPLAIRAEDWKATAALGHKLKSSSRCVGAMQLATLCESLEHAGKHGDAENCTGLAPQVQAEFAELRALMEGELSVVA
jgi:HPt (histidine-containing phosphotransfer) domain-containing protein